MGGGGAPGGRGALGVAAWGMRRVDGGQVEHVLDLTVDGVGHGRRVTALARAGLYVPGGTARYPSSVLMTAIPAKVAGVPEVVMVTPGASPEAMLAARLAHVDRVFELGGAQAIAALAYGTASVPRVAKIVGPGNAWVAAAKRQVYGEGDVDSIVQAKIFRHGRASDKFHAGGINPQPMKPIDDLPAMASLFRVQQQARSRDLDK